MRRRGWLPAARRSDLERTKLADDHTCASADQRSDKPTQPATRSDNVPRGIYFMIAATVMFALSSAISKWVVATYPVGEVMFFRSFSSLVVCAAVVLPLTGISVPPSSLYFL